MALNSVLVTGAAGGLGLAMIEQFAAQIPAPKFIFASDIDPIKSEALRRLATSNTNIHLVQMDVTNDQQIDKAVRYVREIVGMDGLNLLINNAAILNPQNNKFPEIHRQAVNRHFDVNATSPLLLVQAFFPLLKTAADKHPSSPMSVSRAAVINITSEEACMRQKTHLDPNDIAGYAYIASKAALNMFTKNLSLHLKDHGILIAGVCPAYMDTNLTRGVREYVKSQGGRKIIPLTETEKQQISHLTTKNAPEESVKLILATISRLRETHTGGLFRRNGEKLEDYAYSSAVERDEMS